MKNHARAPARAHFPNNLNGSHPMIGRGVIIMNSSVCLNKSILAVVMLVMACFAGVAVVDDVDAAEAEYTVKLDNKVEFPLKSGDYYSNVDFGNNVTLKDGVIVGSVSSSDKAMDAVKDFYPSVTPGEKEYMLVFTIQNLPQGYYVSFMADGKLKSAAVGEGENVITDLTILYRVTDDNKSGKFTYAVTPAKQTGDSLAGLVTYDIPIDLKMDVVERQIEYTINGLTIIDKVDSGTAYSLVALDALNQTVPAGQKFVGWSDGKNTYPVGTTLIISNDAKNVPYQYSAVFEDLPAIVITFIDGTSKVAECNVTEIAAKVPAMEKVGYDFTGWYLNGTIVDPMTYNFTESAVLVAGWEPIKCFVTFTVDGEVYQKQTVEYNDFATQPVAPKGFQGWDFNFATPITGDITVEAIPEPAAEPTGADDPKTLTVYIIVALVVLALILCLVYLLREGHIVIGLGKKKEIEAPAQEEPKQ